MRRPTHTDTVEDQPDVHDGTVAVPGVRGGIVAPGVRGMVSTRVQNEPHRSTAYDSSYCAQTCRSYVGGRAYIA